ncbi:MAG: DUF4349 domain-containing protein [Planctomycetes bacterium]|nr:DUF4349 domain-containing protein [Planctomycetota bacterium]
MSDHAWVEESLDAYVAGGMSAEERGRVAQHLEGCVSCTHTRAEIGEMDHLLDGIFAPVRPDAGLADRAIQKLRQARKPRPSWMRFVTAAAAVILLGMIGGGVQYFVLNGALPLPGAKSESGKVDASPSPVAQVFSMFRAPNPKKGKEMAGEGKFVDGAVLKGAPTDSQDFDEKANSKKKGQEAGYDQMDAYKLLAIDTDKKKATPEGWSNLALPSFYGGKRPAIEKSPVDETARYFDKVAKDDIAKFSDKDKSAELIFRMKEAGKGEMKEDKLRVAMEKMPEELTKKYGDIAKDLANLTPQGLDAYYKNHGYPIPTNGAFGGGMMGMGGGGLPGPGGGFGMGGGMMGMGGIPVSPSFGQIPLPKSPGQSLPPGLIPPTRAADPGYFTPVPPPPIQLAKGDGKKGEEGASKSQRPGDDKGQGKGDNGKPGGEGQPASDNKGGKGKLGGESKPGEGEKPAAQKPNPKTAPANKTGRKIIRTGEMEFETSSFDKAVDSINQLINNVQGGFIATVNSDKLPNGKMRGSVVVRMPPEHLDKFLLDLRRELAKSGELKNQRIGSLDVTKQYTDIESRLRAARAIEERLIAIIKTGKGEIKDLVAAERELGVWRTKIEEMEGEIRYYSNQVALSTLTITIYEKEIQAPSAIVITETVQVRIEVDEVAKAHQAAMKAVGDLKGRITRSDLTQHKAGQFVSILHVDIPPANKDAFTAQLHKLGIVSDFQESQQQRTIGGTGRAPNLKPKVGDVHFEVTMNNTANIRPKLTTDLKIATTDVPAAYGNLLDAIAKAKGQIRDGKLDEKDKFNVYAQIDFNVPTSAKATIDKLLETFGPLLERVNSRARVNEISTDRKFGYTLMLRDFASIPPRQAVVEVLALTDVPAAYARIREAVAKSKGMITTANLNEKDKLNINAQLEFTVPTEERKAIEKLLTELGPSLSRDKIETPINQLATAKKFGFSLLLRDFLSVPPRQSAVLMIASSDVATTYATLLDAIAKAKGNIADSKLNEQDKLNVNAQLTFTVPSEEQKGLEKMLADISTVLTRTNVKTPMNVLATTKKFGFSILIRDFASIPPSKATDLTVATNDVPASFAKLLDAVAKAKGRVVDAKLNEQDKFNISAQIGFSIPSEEKETIDKLLVEIGSVLSRSNVQASVNQLSLAKKFGYSVTLRDFATIKPTYAAEVTIAAREIPNNYAKLVDAVVKVKGQISKAELDEKDKLNIKAMLNFTVPTTEKPKFDKLLEEMGTLLSRNNVQAPLNTLTTDGKFGYSLVLRDFAHIPPRETFYLSLAATDVPTAFRELQDAVKAAQGLVTVGLLTEDSKVKVEAKFDFTIPSAKRQEIEALFSKVGAVLARTSNQAGINDLATDQKVGFKLTIRSTAVIPPREIITLKLDVKDVDTQAAELRDLITAGRGRVIDSNINRLENGKVSGVLTFEVPFASQDTLLRQIKGTGTLVSQQAKRNPQIPENSLTTSHIFVTLNGATPIVPSDEGLSSYVRTSLYMSFKVFSVCIMLIILGVSAVLPWVLVIWVVYKVYARMTANREMQLATEAGPVPPADAPPPA